MCVCENIEIFQNEPTKNVVGSGSKKKKMLLGEMDQRKDDGTW